MMLPYFVNVGIILGACLAFYKLLLRRETFYGINRFLLIACLALSFALPLLKVPQQFSLGDGREQIQVDSRESGVVSRESLVVSRQSTEANQQLTVDNDSKQPETINQKPETKAQPQAASYKLQANQIMRWLFLFYWFGVIVFGI